MKVAVTAQDGTLDAEVDPRFGRCSFFVIVDPETMTCEAVRNESAGAGSGAGVQAGQLVAEQDVRFVLTGNCGPNAFKVCEAAGIKVITDVSGTVRDAVEKLKNHEYSVSDGPSVGPHHGMRDQSE